MVNVGEHRRAARISKEGRTVTKEAMERSNKLRRFTRNHLLIHLREAACGDESLFKEVFEECQSGEEDRVVMDEISLIAAMLCCE